MSISKTPLDFEKLEKGDVVTSEMIEEAMNCKVGSKDYDFKLMALRHMIFVKTGFLAKTENDTELRILTAEESVSYTDKLAKQALKKYDNAFHYAQSIDFEELSDTSKRKLENQLINQGRIQQSIRLERRKITQEAKKNQLNE